jgi:SAM-dependent methyltransferase
MRPLRYWKLWREYKRDLRQLKEQMGDDRDFPFGRPYPILNEKDVAAGVMSGAYFHQDLLVARRIFENHPRRHVDIGSRIDGFVAHVASFREIELFDIRRQEKSIRNVVFRQADLMQLPAQLVGYCDSVSSLHAIEHFGLGRYGDPIDYLGHVKAIENVRKILTPGGWFYFSVPIGPQRIEFNAHRVFSLTYLLKVLEEGFKVRRFSFVDDSGDLHEDVELSSDLISSNARCNYGCGIFELAKV